MSSGKHRGATTLVAVAALVGGLAVGGAGTAAAELSSDLKVDFLTGIGSSDRIGCPEAETYSDTRHGGDITMHKVVSTPAYPGAPMSSTYTFESSDPNAYIRRLTEYLPSTDYMVNRITVDWKATVDGVDYPRSDNPGGDIDTATNSRTIKGAWPASATFVFHYIQVPWAAKAGEVHPSGGGFTALGGEAHDWPVMEGTGFEVVEPPLTCG